MERPPLNPNPEDRKMGRGGPFDSGPDCDRKVTEEADNRHTTHLHFATQMRKGVEGENGDTYRVGGVAAGNATLRVGGRARG